VAPFVAADLLAAFALWRLAATTFHLGAPALATPVLVVLTMSHAVRFTMDWLKLTCKPPVRPSNPIFSTSVCI
jgi:hypothetical protein